MNTPALPKRYSIASLLGEGGQGRVYRVRDSLRDRDLALKLVSAADAEFLRREFDTLRQIRHENLIQVFDWGSLESGEALYTMELVEGEDWGHRMGAAQPAEEVRRILTGLLRGLAHLHCHGEIHGDLKPGNILLGQGGVVKVTDVGMAGSVKGGIAGTPGYTAPECWEGKPADVRSDLYSVGVMAYEALTGKHPFGARTIREVVAGQIEGWVPSPGAHRVKVPADLERVVMRALEREPALRQGSADDYMEGFGVEDRVGVILGGKFVGREQHLAEILDALRSPDPRRPTLLSIVGQAGSGKETLLRELAHQLSTDGVRVAGWADSDASHGENVSGVVLLSSTGAQHDDQYGAAVQKAREAWAGAIEAGCPAGVAFVNAATTPNSDKHPFEFQVELEALDPCQAGKYVDGILGNTSLPEPLIGRIHAISGGIPENLSIAVRALIDRGFLARRASRWYFNENTEIRSLTIPEVASPWKATWQRLDDTEREAVVALALAQGLTAESSNMIGIARGCIERLQSRGHVRQQAERWMLASEATRLGVLDVAESSLVERVARRLLSTNVLGTEQSADLSLKLKDPNAIEVALVAADSAAARGELYLAISRFHACREIARSVGNDPLARTCELREAEALNTVGRFKAAAELLNHDSPADAKREHLSGVAKRGLGDLSAAARHFEQAYILLESANRHDDALWSLCELAEIRWRYGGEHEKLSIVKVIEHQLELAAEISLDLRAALHYHLGASLMAIGDLSRSRRALEGAVGFDSSPYWQMRLRIALGTLEHRSGDVPRALRYLDEAWVKCELSGADAFRPRIMTNRGAALYQNGRFRDALDANSQGLQWARRVGNYTELMFAACGTAGCRIVLGDYGAAEREGAEASEIAERYGDPVSQEKAIELLAWVAYWLGEYSKAKDLAKAGLERFSGKVGTETRARLHWVLGRALDELGDSEGSAESLRKAMEILERSRDPEDLPGVQIETLRLHGKSADDVERKAIAGRLREIVAHTSVPTVETSGVIGIGEVLFDCPSELEAHRDLLLKALASAESSEIAEASWRINYYIGALSRAQGDTRNSRTRFSAALKGLQRIADRLGVDQRARYLASFHVRPLLESMSSSN